MTAATDIPSTAEFRSRLGAWLDENDLTPPPGDHSLDAHHAQHSRVLSALYDAGWMRYGWPESAGGLGGPAILRAVVGEEIVGRGLDEPGPYSMLDVLTPTMIDYAHPDLAAEMVPLLLSGRETWCQGFSEPGSGSDLASLSTRAEQRGDDWVVNGQKVWTSFAQYATRCVLLTRTGAPGTPNHEAITAFFVDLDSPGITVRPLRTMHGVDEFCEVYFDDVIVPADRMLGKPGDGWRLAMDLLPFERSTCFWQRIAYLYSRFDRLIAEVNAQDRSQDGSDDAALGAAYVGLHTLRCRSRDTQYRLDGGTRLGADTSIDKVLLATAEQRLYDTVHDLLPGAIELDESPWRTEYLYSRAATIYGGTAEIQRNIIARRLLDLGEGMMVDAISAGDLDMLADTLRKTMTASCGQALDKSLVELGWLEMLEEMPDTAIPLAFRLLGETGAHAPVINDVVLTEAGRGAGETVPLPYAGGAWVVWERTDEPTTAFDDETPVHRVSSGEDVPLAAGRRALGWWLVGASRAMLALARQHALDRVQFGRPVASFQAIRHRMAETLVAIEGAEATLGAATDDFGSLLAKAAAGQAALTAAKHCQQVLGGIGFTAEHELHRHVKRALLLDGLLGSARELTREAGATLRAQGFAPRVVDL